MNKETLTYCKNRLRTKSKRSKLALLKAIVKSKLKIIESANTTIHYTKEIKQQARVFRANFNQDFNRFNKEEL